MPYVHNLDPIAFSIGPLAIRWYGLMYLIGFLLFLVLGKLRARDPWRDMKSQDVDDLLFYGMIGTIVGGRLGHVLFYGPLSYYLESARALRGVTGGWPRTAESLAYRRVAWFARGAAIFFARCRLCITLARWGLARSHRQFINGECGAAQPYVADMGGRVSTAATRARHRRRFIIPPRSVNCLRSCGFTRASRVRPDQPRLSIFMGWSHRRRVFRGRGLYGYMPSVGRRHGCVPMADWRCVLVRAALNRA